MKNIAKLIIASVFGLSALVMFLGSVGHSRTGSIVRAEGGATPTPAANVKANVAANSADPNKATANTTVTPAATATPAKPPVAETGDKKIPKSFVLGKDSLSAENGEVPFDHDSHAFQKYSPDGKSVMGCVECHHTDVPKSALKPPFVTSERDTLMTFDVWKTLAQKVSDCRACHFQDGNVPDGKTMPATTKDLTNELAYHINCNNCHDAAFKLRPELKSKPGLATSKDCSTCHKKG